MRDALEKVSNSLRRFKIIPSTAINRRAWKRPVVGWKEEKDGKPE